MGIRDSCTNNCGRPVPDACYICPDCGTALERKLTSLLDETIPGPTEHRTRTITDDAGTQTVETYVQPLGPDRHIPGISSALNDAITRQVRFTKLPAGAPPAATVVTADDNHTLLAETPLPFGYTASEARFVLRTTLARWVGYITEQRGTRHPVYTIPSFARYLTDQIRWLRQQPAGHEAFDEIASAINNATRAIDRPADRIYAGPCRDLTRPTNTGNDCPGHLYAREHSPTATCDTCNRTTSLNAARDPLIEQIDGMLLPASDIVTALGGLGSRIKVNALYQWAHRGRLTNHAPEGARPLYRVGDVRLLALTQH